MHRQTNDHPTSTGIHFLLVDDLEDNLVALEALLRRDGLTILKARSGAEALELLLVHDVALAFIDVQMPEMDGFELAELMRGAERTKHVPIIFVTAGSRDPQRVFKGYETGAVDVLFKPIDPHVLRSKADVFFELSRHRAELANALRLNEMFIGILGHDLRNPLGVLLTGSQLLSQQLHDEKHLKTLRRMTAAGQRMRDMIEQLLDLTRARMAGGLGFARARKPLSVVELVQRTVDELRTTHPDREVLVHALGDCNSTGDPDRLLQLFSNLIANAIQHGAPGSPVAVTIEGSDRNIAVRVRNRGAIPEDLLPTIFDPFRGRSSSRSQGLGLGLYVAQQIAIAHSGNIAVESTEASGTVFTVTLPRRAVTERIDTVSRRKSVLVVEDDLDIREALRETFEEEGYETRTAANGREALDILRAGTVSRPDVVILDLVLPVIDGGRVYVDMQSDPSLAKIPVIVSTGSPARAPTGALVMPKPLSLDRLLGTVAELCGRESRAEP